jgi:hypothetical protein
MVIDGRALRNYGASIEPLNLNILIRKSVICPDASACLGGSKGGAFRPFLVPADAYD